MNRRKRRIGIALLLLLVLICFPVWSVYRGMPQARLDAALIEAINAGDNQKALKALAQGANGKARDHASTFSEAWYHMWRHNEYLPALLLTCRYSSGRGPELAVVRALLDHGANVNDRDVIEKSPLFYATRYSNGDLIRLLLARGADMETKDFLGNTPLFGASAESAKVLLEHRANIEAKNPSQETPLLYATLPGSFVDVDVVQVLLDHGANIEAVDNNKRTPLIDAVMYAELDKVRLLLEHGAKVRAKDVDGKMALDYVRNKSDSNSRKIIALLRQYGAK